jgi:Fic family protein
MENIEKAIALKSELDQIRPISPEREAVIMQKFRLDWDYHSNHLEGNSLTYGETKALIMFGITAQGKPLQDHFEITGHDEAIKWVIDVVKGEYPLTEKFIRELHKLLLKTPHEVNAITPEGNPTTKRIEVGKYKAMPNHVKTITGETFRFATPEETPALMQDLIEWYREKKASSDTNSILLAAEFHYRFIRIHPFDDGNGRIARILMNFILMQYGYPPVIIKTEDKGNYFSALQQADSGMIEPFIDYIASNLVRSLEIMIAGTKGESIEEPDDLDKEIALLEKKLKASTKKIKTTKSMMAILDVYNKSIVPLMESFIVACEKFDIFYHKSYFKLGVAYVSWNKTKIDAAESGRKLISSYSDLQSLSLWYSFEKFTQEGFDEFNYESKIDFEFGLVEYAGVASNNTIFRKSYGIQLTDKEIDRLVKAETTKHKELIETKLISVQNKNPNA